MGNAYLDGVVATEVKCNVQDKQGQLSAHTKMGRQNMKI